MSHFLSKVLRIILITGQSCENWDFDTQIEMLLSDGESVGESYSPELYHCSLLGVTVIFEEISVDEVVWKRGTSLV